MDAVWKFRFPCTGKAFPNMGRTAERNGHERVSIPFNREGISERVAEPGWLAAAKGFHSLPPGRHFRTINRTEHDIIVLGFHSLQPGRHFRTTQKKRLAPSFGSFHSLQPGRHFRTVDVDETAFDQNQFD